MMLQFAGSRRLTRTRIVSISALVATLPPLIDHLNTPTTAADQITVTAFAPSLMPDGSAIVGTPVMKFYFGTNRDEVEKGPSGSGTTVRTKSAGVWTHTETGVANGTYYGVVTSLLDEEESYESETLTFTVT